MRSGVIRDQLVDEAVRATFARLYPISWRGELESLAQGTVTLLNVELRGVQFEFQQLVER